MKIVPLLLMTLLVAGPAAAQQAIDESVATSAGGRVEIHNVSGSVRVTGWDRNEIRVTGTLGRGAERLEISPRGDVTEIRVVIPRNASNVRGSDLEIRLPARKEVTVRTTSADVGVDEVTGAVSAHSTSGDVRVAGRPESVSAASTSGDVDVQVTTARARARSTSGDVLVRGTVRESVDVESVSGDVGVMASAPEVRAKTVSGDLSLHNVTGRVSASTVSGDAEILDSRVQYLSFESVSGSLRFAGDLVRGGAFNLQNHSGDVELRLPAGVDAEFDATTFSGDIESRLGGQVQRTNRYGPGQALRFTAGNGGTLVTVKTFSGSVRLLRR